MNRAQILIIFLFVLYWITQNTLAPPSSIKVFDVGQGEAILLNLDGAIVLVDGGPSFELDRYLSTEFVGKGCHVELLVLTHPHADHIKGLNRILKRCEVRAVAFPNIEYDSNLYAVWLDLTKGIERLPLVKGSEISINGFDFLFVWPTPAYAQEASNINNVSLAFLLKKGAFEALFLGDLEQEALELLDLVEIQEHVEGHLDIYKVPHHGARGSSFRPLVLGLSPKLCVISAGEGNRFGHPHRETVDVLREAGCSILRTDHLGTLEFYIPNPM